MINVNDLLNLARSWIGKNEADGSYREIIDIYNTYKPLARGYKVKYTDNWCAVFISSLAIRCNCTDIIPTECSCGKMIQLFKNIGCWQDDGNIVPKMGDIIFYDWDKKDGWPEHVGIVEDIKGNQIIAIEGNKSNAVGRRTIVVGNASICGYGIVKYDISSSNIQDSFLNKTDYKVVVNTSSGVNCRKVPNGDKITAYPNGTVLHIIAEKDGWGFDGIGWVSLQYCKKNISIKNKPLGIYEVTASALIVRTGPGINYARKIKTELTEDGQKHSNNNGALLKGTKVSVIEWNNDWAHIPSGWISGEYLKQV